MTGIERIVVLSGAGLSAASGIPTFRGEGGLWEGHDAMDLATPEAFQRDPDLVTRFYDTRRRGCVGVSPNPGHEALARLQTELGTDRVTMVTQNIDGLLDAAGAPEVLEMHGSIWRLRCEAVLEHGTRDIRADQDRDARCAVCDRRLRPDVVWFGEMPRFLHRIERALHACDLFVAVGTSGVVYPAAGFGQVAKGSGARTLEVNPEPSGAPWFEAVIDEGAETALPRLVERLLA